jgi:hypothetical protein
MGNNNDDPSDDITYRNGTIAFNRTDRAIYQAAITCKFSCFNLSLSWYEFF